MERREEIEECVKGWMTDSEGMERDGTRSEKDGGERGKTEQERGRDREREMRNGDGSVVALGNRDRNRKKTKLMIQQGWR